jgi:hypothetical protein
MPTSEQVRVSIERADKGDAMPIEQRALVNAIIELLDALEHCYYCDRTGEEQLLELLAKYRPFKHQEDTNADE